MINALVRRYGLFGYWIVFAALTLYEAQFPGYVLHPEQAPYPWLAILCVWALLAVLVSVLHVILRPKTFQYQWSRVVRVVVFATILLGLAIVSFVTDMPGWYYVPFYFSFVTMVAVLVLALVGSASALWRRIKHAA